VDGSTTGFEGPTTGDSTSLATGWNTVRAGDQVAPASVERENMSDAPLCVS